MSTQPWHNKSELPGSARRASTVAWQTPDVGSSSTMNDVTSPSEEDMRGTPTFLIDGKRVRGSRTIGELSDLIEAAGPR